MKKLDPIITNIQELCNPVSIFLYGSRVRTDFLVDSDYEIGVLIPRNRYIGVMRIRESIPLADDVHVFPFELEDFLAGIIDTPFQKSIYLRELALSATTLAGENIIENLVPPPIKVIDLIQEVRFNLGYALASLMSYRNGDIPTASFEFYKSNLFGTRCLNILKAHLFPLGYDQIFESSNKLDLGEYSDLVETAFEIRQGKTWLDDGLLYKNISYLNDYIEKLLLEYYTEHGNEILIS